jgi:hypothetical protein
MLVVVLVAGVERHGLGSHAKHIDNKQPGAS